MFIIEGIISIVSIYCNSVDAINIYIYRCVCVRVCVHVFMRVYIIIHNMYIYIYMYVDLHIYTFQWLGRTQGGRGIHL